MYGVAAGDETLGYCCDFFHVAECGGCGHDDGGFGRCGLLAEDLCGMIEEGGEVA